MTITRIIGLFLLLTPFLGYAQNTSDQFSFEATVERIEEVPCENENDMCARLFMRPTDDALFNGEDVTVDVEPHDQLGPIPVSYKPGDTLIVQTQEMNGERQFFVSDYVRRTPLLWLAALFVLSVFLFGGLGAMRSFVGMIISLGIVLGFMLPKILAGNSPITIALIGACAIMIITFVLSHGWNKKTWAAFGGTAASLLLTALLAGGFSVYAHLTGTADEEMLFLLTDYPLLDTRGILLAGIIIGSLGVLDDITISQASAVFELRKANPFMHARALYRSALRIGADHIAAAVNTLVLAYAGTALPLLLLLVGVPAGESWYTFINREMIAEEIIRTLTGSIGLLAAVPLTTLLATWFAMKTDVAELGAVEGHTH